VLFCPNAEKVAKSTIENCISEFFMT